MNDSYRGQFGSAAAAAAYQQKEYDPTSYSSLLWRLEQPILSALVAEFRQRRGRVELLDFAAGTGRITAHLEAKVDTATAIEISPHMAAIAQSRLRTARVLCQDITAEGDQLEARYDLITAFRFFLNAEPRLREAALGRLVARLRDDSSWLIFNNHGNLWSSKLFGWPLHRTRMLLTGRQREGNYMTEGEVKRLLAPHGLRILRRVGLGVLGGRLAKQIGFERALRWEQRLMQVPGINRWVQDVIYVVSRQG